MTVTKGTKADRLIAEFRSLGLGEANAHRSAFVALALRRGWSKGRISRYLGISRARVGQRVDKMEHYVSENPGSLPTLKAALSKAEAVAMELAAASDSDRKRKKAIDRVSESIAFDAHDWDDIDFARRLVDSLVDD